MDALKDISMDVRQLISISEKIYSTVLRGRALTPDETEIVRECTTQLFGLTKIPTPPDGPCRETGPFIVKQHLVIISFRGLGLA